MIQRGISADNLNNFVKKSIKIYLLSQEDRQDSNAKNLGWGITPIGCQDETHGWP